MSADNPDSMAPPAVALLFENAQHSAHLRDALLALGADIVLEQPATDIDAQTLADSGAHVVVINLDAAVEPHLDRIHDAVDASQQRVVYNDGDASGRLSGWDQARWARHLAAKLMQQFDTDPPRPENARPVQVDVLQPPVDEAAAADEDMSADAHAAAVDEADTQEAPAADDVAAVPVADQDAHDDLALSLVDVDDDSASADPGSHSEPQPDPTPAGGVIPADSEESAALIDPPTDSADAATENTIAASPQAPEWELVATDAEPAGERAQDDLHVSQQEHGDTPLDAASFGIDKVSAAEYLTPSAEQADESPVEPGFSLELVSLEEAVAPSMVETPVHEISLDAATGLRRLVVIGATVASVDLVADFLHALSARPDVAMLLIQHQEAESVEALRVRLAEATDVPVRTAEHGDTVRRGELTIVPRGRQPSVDRSGRMQLDEAIDFACDPSIDAALSTAAAQFASDALAILLVDDANDAVAGAQAIHDRGGRLWLHHRAPGERSSMVSMLRQEGLIDLEDTPASFAARLLDEAGAL